ncbi:MAG TPA: hypothetical protein V6C88_06905, partial [Chroococcidiopsis sp.]
DVTQFPQDLIADYYLAVAPVGFKALYGALAAVGIEPRVAALGIPLLIALVATVYLYGVTLQIVPVPLAALCSTLVFNQNIWLKDDLISAAPRAFVYGLFAAFLYYLLRRSPLPCLVLIALQGVLYPQMALVAIALLTVRLFSWQGRSLRWSTDRRDYWVWLAAIAIGGVCLLGFSRAVSEQWGATISAAQMQQMPEFGPGGRRQYFGVNPFLFWFAGASGLRLPLFPPIIVVGLGLPWLLRSPLPLARAVTANVQLLGQLAMAAMGMFGLAHLIFPVLYLPSRYSFYSLRFVMAIATGLVLAIALDAVWRWWQVRRRSGRSPRLRHWAVMASVTLLAIAVVVVPAVPAIFLPCQGWVIGTEPAVYRFLDEQPSTVRVASLSEAANTIPAFAQRSVVAGSEFALPYHLSFYRQMQQRIVDLAKAQYSPDRADLQAAIATYGVDFWLLDRDFLQPNYLSQQPWLLHSTMRADVEQAIARSSITNPPAIAQDLERCAAITTERLILLNADCLADSVESTP